MTTSCKTSLSLRFIIMFSDVKAYQFTIGIDRVDNEKYLIIYCLLCLYLAIVALEVFVVFFYRYRYIISQQAFQRNICMLISNVLVGCSLLDQKVPESPSRVQNKLAGRIFAMHICTEIQRLATVLYFSSN